MRSTGRPSGWRTIGLAQHSSIDVFMPMTARDPLQKIAPVNDLATLLFD